MTALRRPANIRLSGIITAREINTLSLAGYTLSAFPEQKDYGSRHLTAMSFNRSSLFIKLPQD